MKPYKILLLTLLYLYPLHPHQSNATPKTLNQTILTPTFQKSIQKGLDWLAKQQDPDSGVVLSPNNPQYPLATTALAGLAFLAHPESSYKRGRYGQNIALVLHYIRSLVLEEDGQTIKTIPGVGVWISDGKKSGRMHAHCYATLFLTEVYGTLQNPQLEQQISQIIRGSIQLFIHSQTQGKSYVFLDKQGKSIRQPIEWGGWGYYYRGEPGWGDDEASITVCVLQALRSAKNAGFYVPTSVIQKAINYVRFCRKSDGSFRYSLSQNNQRSSFELTAAALSTLNAAGVYALSYHQHIPPSQQSPLLKNTHKQLQQLKKNFQLWQNQLNDAQHTPHFLKISQNIEKKMTQALIQLCYQLQSSTPKQPHPTSEIQQEQTFLQGSLFLLQKMKQILQHQPNLTHQSNRNFLQGILYLLQIRKTNRPDTEIIQGLGYLIREMDDENNPWNASQHWPFYGSFYLSQTLYHSSNLLYGYYYPKLAQTLLAKQSQHGYWKEQKYGNAYATAMAVLILEIPYQTLPIFQR